MRMMRSGFAGNSINGMKYYFKSNTHLSFIRNFANLNNSQSSSDSSGFMARLRSSIQQTRDVAKQKKLSPPPKVPQQRVKDFIEKDAKFDRDRIRAIRTAFKPVTFVDNLIEAKNAMQLPSFECAALAGSKVDLAAIVNGRVTLLAVSYNRLAEMHAASWIKPFLEAYPGDNRVQALQLIVSEGHLPNLMRSSLMTNLRSQYEMTRHSSIFPVYPKFSEHSLFPAFKQALNITSQSVCHALLLDSQGRIRLRGSGEANSDEIGSFLRHSAKLVDQIPEQRV
jgi:hypothetical protein